MTNIHRKALIRDLIHDVGVGFCSQEKSDATNMDLERTRLMPISLPVMLFPFKGKLKVHLSNQRNGEGKRIPTEKG